MIILAVGTSKIRGETRGTYAQDPSFGFGSLWNLDNTESTTEPESQSYNFSTITPRPAPLVDIMTIAATMGAEYTPPQPTTVSAAQHHPARPPLTNRPTESGSRRPPRRRGRQQQHRLLRSVVRGERRSRRGEPQFVADGHHGGGGLRYGEQL